MANSYFQFKQFRIEQKNAAMKVGTDGVLLGAWAEVDNAASILDIGTGTGLIALMLAQRSTAKIVAIDVEENAVLDARLNFRGSPWANRLNVQHIPLQEFVLNQSGKFDCIVCNPPFFTNSEKSPQSSRNIARHTDSLSFTELVNGVAQLLTQKGRFCVILPIESETEFIDEALIAGFKLSKITRIKPKPSKLAKRVLMEFTFHAKTTLRNELTVETETRHVYTPEFNELAKPFYLKL